MGNQMVKTYTDLSGMNSNLLPYKSLIEKMLHDKYSDEEISTYLQFECGLQRGSSKTSIRRFCSECGMTRQHTKDQQLEMEVYKAINETGPTYGRKMMTGYLKTKGVHASEGRVGKMLRVVHQPYHVARSQGARNLNPVQYYAEYTGHKLHIDQNEKLVMFGVTHVLAIDGFSSKIVGHSTMPVKNNLTIYEDVYRTAVMTHGMWDQVRVDHGKEFYLTLYMQEKLASYRFNTERQPYLQTTSKMNHAVERMWPEVNNRVNYPLKLALVQLVNQEELDTEDSLMKYCVSSLTCQIAQVGVHKVVHSWNAHRIPGKGIPNDLARNGCPTKVNIELLPSASVAADHYDSELGASLTRVSRFGLNPFDNHEDQQTVEREFKTLFPDVADIFDSAVNHQPAPLQEALRTLIDITRRHVQN